MPQALDELIAKLEVAPEGSRELDLAIARSLYPQWAFRIEPAIPALLLGTRVMVTTESGADEHVNITPYTTSLDGALTLVPEGAVWHVMTDYGNLNRAKIGPTGRPSASVYHSERHRENFIVADAETPALALCIAALRARSTTGEDNG